MIPFQNLCLPIWDDIFITPAHQYDQRSVRKHQLRNGFIAPTMLWGNLLLSSPGLSSKFTVTVASSTHPSAAHCWLAMSKLVITNFPTIRPSPVMYGSTSKACIDAFNAYISACGSQNSDEYVIVRLNSRSSAPVGWMASLSLTRGIWPYFTASASLVDTGVFSP